MSLREQERSHNSNENHTYQMNTKILSVLCSLAVALLTSCDTGAIGALRMFPHVTETYAQNQEVTLLKPFSIKIEKCYWMNEFERPGFANLPEQFRKEQRAQIVAEPAGKFLVVELSIKNLSNEPVGCKPLIFRLRNAKGSQFASSQEVNTDDLTSKMILGQASMNPEMSIKGKKVFDVPKQDYVMEVSIGVHAGGFQFYEGAMLFKWSLAPTESK